MDFRIRKVFEHRFCTYRRGMNWSIHQHSQECHNNHSNFGVGLSREETEIHVLHQTDLSCDYCKRFEGRDIRLHGERPGDTLL